MRKNWKTEEMLVYLFFKKREIGDTIIIKVLPSKLPESLIIENLEYKSCYGTPPKEGWKQLPNCN